MSHNEAPEAVTTATMFNSDAAFFRTSAMKLSTLAVNISDAHCLNLYGIA